ncbi:glycoside hydrolase family 73 protein [Lactobacillus sp. 3B(2020)]|uniref:glycoside hydrolase family 73 protein n=1 Tax=Lactobacillus sp. 3B(2020) TaxID=2695882 RepID=UPI00210832BA|nr:glycoside hydrolase family 73 protein [Lactobacillus sp. 3B(2020)]
MARKRKSHKKGRNWGLAILAILVIFMAVYVGHHFYVRYQQEQIIKKEQNSKRLFIQAIAPESQAMQKQYHVYASITMAQAILESDWGSSKLAADYHNLFGIKGEGENSKVLSTKEYTNGKWVVIKGRFRVYDSWADSIKDHTQLMVKGTAYNQQNYQEVINATDYQTAARALQKAGYATDPDYAQKLINVIKTYNLDQYDR